MNVSYPHRMEQRQQDWIQVPVASYSEEGSMHLRHRSLQ